MSTQQQVDSLRQDATTETMETIVAVTGLRTERMQVKPSGTLGTLAKLSNNFYNEANYRIRQ